MSMLEGFQRGLAGFFRNPASIKKVLNQIHSSMGLGSFDVSGLATKPVTTLARGLDVFKNFTKSANTIGKSVLRKSFKKFSWVVGLGTLFIKKLVGVADAFVTGNAGTAEDKLVAIYRAVSE